ncbi:MAG: FKBP-type peptidyl-prolyl cis-trans isomerase [Cryobacterium sp.]|nr:FKBP-type peptidyl-prolyl cis-trans isomerase [Cryobacterium sp.]
MPSHSPIRPTTASLAAAALLMSLAACATPETPTTPEEIEPAAVDVCATPTGAAVEAVTATGELGDVPEVTFDAGLAVESAERQVIVEGAGRPVEDGSLTGISFVVYNGTTGLLLEEIAYDEGGPYPFMAQSGNIPGILKAIGCVTEGSRVIAASLASEIYGPSSVDEPGFKVEPTDTIILVLDVVRIIDRAWGADQPAVDGMPTVVLDADGAPTVTLPDTAMPTELQLAVLKKGDGPVVAEHADVMVQYHGVSWDTREVFDSSWLRPAASEFSLDGVIQGFTLAIAGQTLGSQVLVVAPPEFAYGPKTGAANEHALAGQTLVFVIDILLASEHAG